MRKLRLDATGQTLRVEPVSSENLIVGPTAGDLLNTEKLHSLLSPLKVGSDRGGEP